MTVEQFQRIYEISITTPDTIERIAWMICDVFGKTPDQVDSITKDQFVKYADKLTS